jgi:hypothetical protein
MHNGQESSALGVVGPFKNWEMPAARHPARAMAAEELGVSVTCALDPEGHLNEVVQDASADA